LPPTKRNFLFAALGASAVVSGAFFRGAAEKAGGHFYENSQIGHKVDKLLLEAERDVMALLKDLPVDKKAAVLEIIRRLRRAKTPEGPLDM
jgi:hypothetical protein